MNTWLISELYYPEQNATGYFLTGIAEALAGEPEAQVSVLCAQPSYNQRGQRAPKEEFRKGVKICRCASTTFDPRKIWGRLLNFMTVTVSIGWRALWSIKKGEKVMVVTNPPLLPFLIFFICRIRGAKLVLLVHDVYPDVFVPLGIMKASSPLYRIFSWINGKLYALVDRVVVLGRDMAKLVEHKSNGKAEVVIIPNWGEIEAIFPAERSDNALLEGMGLGDKFIVHYSGNHGRTHDLESILKAALHLRDEKEIHFLFIGEGSGKAAAVALAEELELVNVSFCSFVDRAELQVSLNASDVSILSFKPGMAGISVPSRLYNLMATGKPIIGIVDAQSEVASVIREAEMGMIVPPESPEGLVKAIQELKRDKESRELKGRNARNAAVKSYTYDAIAMQYKALFNSF